MKKGERRFSGDGTSLHSAAVDSLLSELDCAFPRNTSAGLW
jgi:hypothetical protein